MGDPGLLVGRLISRPVEPKWTLGIVPHYVDQNHPALQALQQRHPEEVKVIDVLQPVENCLREISGCEYIASSSLHGLIAAEALGKPNIWLLLSNKVIGQGFKFRDYFSGLGEEETHRLPVKMTGSETFSKILHHADKPGRAVTEAIARLDERFQSFRSSTFGSER